MVSLFVMKSKKLVAYIITLSYVLVVCVVHVYHGVGLEPGAHVSEFAYNNSDRP